MAAEQQAGGYADRIRHNGYEAELFGEYSYTLEFSALAVSASSTPQIISIQNDADFLWIATSWAANVNGAAVSVSTNPLPLCTIQTQLSGEPFQNSEMPLPSLAGRQPGDPRPLLVPFWLPGGSSFTVSLRNYSSATTYDVWVSFHGLKYKKTKGA